MVILISIKYTAPETLVYPTQEYAYGYQSPVLRFLKYAKNVFQRKEKVLIQW